jgi:hypothetical protein
VTPRTHGTRARQRCGIRAATARQRCKQSSPGFAIVDARAGPYAMQMRIASPNLLGLLGLLAACGDNLTPPEPQIILPCEPPPGVLPTGTLSDPRARPLEGCLEGGLRALPGRWFVAAATGGPFEGALGIRVVGGKIYVADSERGLLIFEE